MNGTTILRPASRVCWYFPKRSTMPARACGTILTVLASMTMANSASRASTMSAVMTLLRLWCSGFETVDGVDVGGGAADLEHLDGLAGLDGERLVVGLGAPDVAGEPHPPGLQR